MSTEVDVHDDALTDVFDTERNSYMLHKNKTTIPAGEITTWMVRGQNTLTFKISVFMMGHEYAMRQNLSSPVREIEVMAYDPEDMTWKVLIPNGIFSNTEVEAMVEADHVLEEVRDFLKDFFGIEVSW